jgi:23S rRNA pseudouridine1911/1915/1917 synthase
VTNEKYEKPEPITDLKFDIEEGLPGEIDVTESGVGMRLDTWLSRIPGTPSRNRIQQLVKDGHVLIGGSPAKRSYTLDGSEKIVINWPPLDDDWPWPQDIPLDIVYEDDHLIVVNKPFGLVVHPAPGHPDNTLVNALLHHCPDLPGINGVKRPGIVHRLDRDTTGLMVVAKTEQAMSSLARQLQNHTVSRRYLALVLGDPKWDVTTLDAAIGRDPSNRLKRSIDGGFPRSAVSHFSVVRRSHQFSLIRCKLETGRTHQIRIHLKHLGHPIVCDETYDCQVKRCVEPLWPDQHELKRVFLHYNRPWLHAHTLEFSHPGMDGKMVSFKAPPPEDSQEVLRLVFGEDVVADLCGERIVNV